MANSKFFLPVARCLLFLVATAVLEFTWGCGGEPAQTPLDDAAKARVQDLQNAQKKFMTNKKQVKNPVGEGKVAKGSP